MPNTNLLIAVVNLHHIKLQLRESPIHYDTWYSKGKVCGLLLKREKINLQCVTCRIMYYYSIFKLDYRLNYKTFIEISPIKPKLLCLLN